MRILLVDDEAEILAIISEYLELLGHDITTASNGQEALDLFPKHRELGQEFDLVFTDIKMPVMDGLTFLEKLRLKDDPTSVVLVSGQGDLESSIKALKLGALDFIVKPIHLKNIEEIVNKIESAIAVELESLNATSLITEQTIVLESESKLSNVRNIIGFFNRQLQDICTIFDLDAQKLALCLQECLTNAIIHGNLKVDSNLKEENWSEFDNLIRERESQSEYASKRITVKFMLSKSSVIFEVIDEGTGFDPQTLPSPYNPESWLKLSGRGILFIRSYMDNVEWNTVGNSIKITKQF